MSVEARVSRAACLHPDVDESTDARCRNNHPKITKTGLTSNYE